MPAPTPTAAAPDPLSTWLAGPLGAAVIDAERRAVAAALQDVFGHFCLQIGQWGPADAFLPLARIPHGGLVADPGATGDCVSHASSLAIASHAVDAVLLPHTLDFEPEPETVIREVDRVLVGEGHVLVLGFEPVGLWALRHYVSRDGFPPGLLRPLGPRRLGDWLRVLGFEVLETRRLLHALPIERLTTGRLTRGLDRLGECLDGRLGSVYLLKAKKRVYTLTPVRPRRRARAIGRAIAQPS